MKQTDILIAGAGIGGLACALALAQGGARVRVFEQASALGDVGAGIQLSANAMHVYAALGLEEEILAAGFEPAFATLRNYKSGAVTLRTPLENAHERHYGQKYIHIHRADLIAILSTAATAAGVELHLSQQISGYQQDNERISLNCANGQIEGDLLIGADGINSAVRQTMHGATPARFTGQVAWRGLVPASEELRAVIPPEATVWLGGGQHFVSYYVRSGSLINFVAVQERVQWTEESWVSSGDVNELRQAFAGWNDPIQSLLAACDECFLWGLFEREPLVQWSDERAVLLGDACHPMLPFMAQGAAMAAEDAYVLSRQILANPQSVQSAFERYEHLRKPRTSMLQAISRENGELFHARSLLSKTARALKLRIASAVPSIAASRLDKIYGVNVTRGN